jgi:histidinol phosphatase-like enzyme
MLYIFDLDGTLVEKYGVRILPGVENCLQKLAHQGNALAIATNQAGLSWRLLTNSPRFPSILSMAHRIFEITEKLIPLKFAPWFISVFDKRVKLGTTKYESLAMDLVNACPTHRLFVKPDPKWRKPQAGMLLSAVDYYRIDPDQALFVGDYKTDAEAAIAAGIKFSWAVDFFSET